MRLKQCFHLLKNTFTSWVVLNKGEMRYFMSSMIGEHKTGNTNNEYKIYGKTKMNWVQKQTIRINHTAILLQVEWSAKKNTNLQAIDCGLLVRQTHHR